MATLPPPYSAKDNARAQRYYQRSLRRPSMVGPLLLLIVGIVALLIETGQINGFHLWDWYMRWWPLLLIGVGLLSLGEWWMDRNRAMLGRRSHGGLVVLILMLAVVGYIAGYTSHGLRGMRMFGHTGEGDDLFAHLLGQEHDADQNLNEQVPAGAQIEIQVPHGDVTVTASGDEQIHVQAHQVVFAANDREARRNLDALAPKLTTNGQHVTLRAADNHDGRADLTIEIPAGTVPTVIAGHGDVTVEGLTAAVTISADKGDVKVDNNQGAVHVRMGKGEFDAHTVTGDLALGGRLDDVSISDVEGRATLDGDFFEETHLAHISSNVHFHSSRTDVEVAAIPGDLEIDSGDLQLNNATGPGKISTSAKDVQCSGITGDLRIEDGDGDISLGPVAPLGEIGVHNRNGAIHLTIPKSLGFQLQATAKHGDIDSKLELPANSAGEGKTVTGSVGGGGPRIALVTDHGDIEIERTDASFAPPAPPAPPEPPRPPDGKALRHFHPPRGGEPHPVSQ